MANSVSGESRMARKKKETRQKIVNVAMGLFKRQGFTNTTMEQIAEKTDIARKTLYNHFPAKEAIVDEYVRDISKGYAQETMETLHNLPDTRARLLAVLNRAYEWVEMNLEIADICLAYRLKNTCQGSGYNNDQTGTQSLMAETIRLGQQAGEIRRDISVKMLVKQMDVLRANVVLSWLGDPLEFELRQEMAKVVDLFLYGAIDREGS